jgi:hypothetical protein
MGFAKSLVVLAVTVAGHPNSVTGAGLPVFKDAQDKDVPVNNTNILDQRKTSRMLIRDVKLPTG